MHPAMNELLQLPASERLDLVQDLWDSIGESRRETPVQEWHRELVRMRLAEFDGREESHGLSREEVWEKVDQGRGK